MMKTNKFGFVILSTDRNINGLKSTISSIKFNYPGSPYLCTVEDQIDPIDLTEFKTVCDIYKGKDTITSLINIGVKKSTADWNVIVIAGSYVRPYLHMKLDQFLKSEKDILFPVVDRQMNFIDGSINGIVVHKKAFKEIGDIAPNSLQKRGYNDFEISKLFWAMDAVDKGYKFKAIVGMQIC